MVLSNNSTLQQAPNSPIFPVEAFSPVDMSFSIPENEIISTHSASLSIVLAEPLLFLRGFTAQEYQDKPPTILRGVLIVRVQKPTKIKLISLTFKGIARTAWPEGIPPKKQEILETNELHSHVWPFFNASFPTSDYTSGANMVRFAKDSSYRMNPATENSHARQGASSLSPSPILSNRSNSSSSEKPNVTRKSHHARSTSFSSHNSPESSESTNAIKAFADRLLRAASPSPIPKHKIASVNRSSSSSNVVSFSRSSSSPSHESSFHGLAPRRSFSKDEPIETETQTKGYRTFEPGEYYYNFELPLPQSLPESIDCVFGSVRYVLEAVIDRPGTFRTKVQGTKEVSIIRAPSDNNLEISEPIAISKSWEDQLYYEIVISGKAFPIGTQIPIAFKLTPLAKVELHRIRVYITENCEYYCKNKKVHRVEPTKRFMLEELVSKDGLQGDLLRELAPSGRLGSGDAEGFSVEHEMNSLIAKEFPFKKEELHPNSTYENIKIHHWIKIVLRVSRVPASPSASDPPGKRKHYEISIDSPIQLLNINCTNSNVFLPAYIDPVLRRPSAAASRRPIPIRELDAKGLAVSNDLSRPIHFLRKPSIAPPPFDADEAPPPATDSIGPGSSFTIIPEVASVSLANRQAVTPSSALLSVNSVDSNTVPSPVGASASPPPYESAISDNSTSYSDRFKLYQKQIQNNKNGIKDDFQPDHNRSRSLGVTDSRTGASPLSSLPMTHTSSDTVTTSNQQNGSSSHIALANNTPMTADSRFDPTVYERNASGSVTNRNTSNVDDTEAADQRDRLPSTVSSVDIVDQLDDGSPTFQNYNQTTTSIREEIDPIDTPVISLDTASIAGGSQQFRNVTTNMLHGPSSLSVDTGTIGPRENITPTSSNTLGVRPVITNSSGGSLSESSTLESNQSTLNSSDATSNSNLTPTTPIMIPSEDQSSDLLTRSDDFERSVRNLGETLSKTKVEDGKNKRPLFKVPIFNGSSNPTPSLLAPAKEEGNDLMTPTGSRAVSPVYSSTSSIGYDGGNGCNIDNDDVDVRAVLDRTYVNTPDMSHRPLVAPLMTNAGVRNLNSEGTNYGTSNNSNQSLLFGNPQCFQSYDSFSSNLDSGVGIMGNSSHLYNYMGLDRGSGFVDGIGELGSTHSVGRLDSIGDIGLRNVDDLDDFADEGKPDFENVDPSHALSADNAFGNGANAINADTLTGAIRRY